MCYYRTSHFLCWQVRQANSCAPAHLYPIPLLWQRPLFFFLSFFFHLPSQIRVLFGCFLFCPLLSPRTRSAKENIRVISNGTEPPSSSLYASSRANCGQIFSEVKSKQLKCCSLGGWRGRWKRRSLLSERIGQGRWVRPRHDSDLGKKKKGKKSETLKYPSALYLLLPTTKLPSTPTQQHGRPSLRDWSRTAGVTDTDPSAAAGLRSAEAGDND